MASMQGEQEGKKIQTQKEFTTKSRVTSWQHVTIHLLPQIEERVLLEKFK